MKSTDFSKVLIIGNSGAGKTHFARKLSHLTQTRVIHLDDVFWEPGGFSVRKAESVVYPEVQNLISHEKWIMEGIYGDLAQMIAPAASCVIFLDKSWAECHSGLHLRGQQGGESCSQEEQELKFKSLVDWASLYHERESASSYSGHNEVFENFTNFKIRIKNKEESEFYLKQIKDCLSSI